MDQKQTPWYYKLLGLIALIIGISGIFGVIFSHIRFEDSTVSKENYNKIYTGMTKAEVFAILGNDAMINESETPGVGKMEMYHYKRAFSNKAISITFLNGKVYMKNWVEI